MYNRIINRRDAGQCYIISNYYSLLLFGSIAGGVAVIDNCYYGTYALIRLIVIVQDPFLLLVAILRNIGIRNITNMLLF